MILKPAKILIPVIALVSHSYGDIEDKIFRSGVERTLQVMEYQKNIAESETSLEGKLCYQVNKSLDDFTVVRLEALSLIAGTKPFYYKSNKQKKLCFFVAKDDETYEAYKKLVESKFEDIVTYSPQKSTVPHNAVAILPRLGRWYADMTNSMEVLNKKIEKLKRSLSRKNLKLKRVEKELHKISSILNDGADNTSTGLPIEHRDVGTDKNTSTKPKEVIDVDKIEKQKIRV